MYMALHITITKHGVYHDCAYCTYHILTNGVVPSGSEAFITAWNLLELLQKLRVRAAFTSHNDVLGKIH